MHDGLHVAQSPSGKVPGRLAGRLIGQGGSRGSVGGCGLGGGGRVRRSKPRVGLARRGSRPTNLDTLSLGLGRHRCKCNDVKSTIHQERRIDLCSI